MSTDRQARLALSLVAEPGCAELARTVARWGAAEVWQMLRAGTGHRLWAERAQVLDVAARCRRAETVGARFVVPGDDEWPEAVDALDRCEALDSVGGAPLGLWLRGEPLPVQRGVAVVGARACSGYGEEVAADLGHDLAEAGLTVVSGGAFGVDTAAHRGALAAGGPTIAVLACGVDQPYPAANAGLFAAIRDRGTLVSEHPPGAHPTRARFLARNRLVAALAAGTVVVEAGARSGATNTAGWTTRLGRVLMAVPGPVTSAGSITPHRLIRDGEAVLVASSAEVRSLVAPVGQDLLVEADGGARLFDHLSPDERAVFEAVPGRGSLPDHELVARSGLRPQVALSVLSRLEEQGLVEQRADGGWGLGRARADQTTRRGRRARTAGASG